MALERTLSIVKPDGVARNLIGQVYGRFEKAGLTIIAARMLHLSQAQAEAFYAVHKARPFYKDLVAYMTSGPVIAQVLEGVCPEHTRPVSGTGGRGVERGDDVPTCGPSLELHEHVVRDLLRSDELHLAHGRDGLELVARAPGPARRQRH